MRNAVIDLRVYRVYHKREKYRETYYTFVPGMSELVLYNGVHRSGSYPRSIASLETRNQAICKEIGKAKSLNWQQKLIINCTSSNDVVIIVKKSNKFCNNNAS